MSVKAKFPQQEYELWTMVTQEALLSMGDIMGSYSCNAQVFFVGVYGMFLFWYDDLWFDYSYDLCFPLSSKWC